MRTEATDADDGDHEAVADDSVTIVDIVSYTGLTPGKEHTLTGTLVDRETVRLVPPETPETPTPVGKLPQTGDELPIAGICALAAAGCAASVIGIARHIGTG